MGAGCFGQTRSTKKKDEERSKLIIKNTTEKVEAFLSAGQINDAAAFIESSKAQCKSLGYQDLCMSGLDFTKGYMYQKAAKLDTINGDNYKKRAVVYYEKVLVTYPNNSAAWSNLMKLYQGLYDHKTTISRLEKLAAEYPNERVNLWVAIGDVYKKNKNYDSACSYYSKAYKEDPFSEKACAAMVGLYTRFNYSCTLSGSVRKLAQDCQEIDLPNYAEELLRKELSLALADKDNTKATKSLILWANLLADEGWEDMRQINRVFQKAFPDTNQSSNLMVYSVFLELKKILQAKNVDQMGDISFWANPFPRPLDWGDRRELGPKTVLIKFLHVKGRQAYFRKDLQEAESFWVEALKLAKDYDNAYFTVVASDLAKFYNTHPKLDPEDQKLNDLVVDLFDMKGAAYEESDLEMIRKYHITLGAIFYDKKKWEGGYATNAEFQLKRAISERLGPIVNPRLKSMLGDVYKELDRKEDAVNAYSLSVQDYLSLDQVSKAEKLLGTVNTNYERAMNDKQRNTLTAVGSIINWRKELSAVDNDVKNNQKKMSQYLEETTNLEKEVSKALPEDFVKGQFFKGLSDLGSQLPDNRQKDKQILYASALNRITEVKTLSSPKDYGRIKTIKTTLEESVDRSGKLEKTQIQKKANLTYIKAEPKEGTKTYSIPTLGKEIMVPKQLFDLNGALQKQNRLNATDKTVKLQLQNGSFKVKNK